MALSKSLAKKASRFGRGRVNFLTKKRGRQSRPLSKGGGKRRTLALELEKLGQQGVGRGDGLGIGLVAALDDDHVHEFLA